MWGRKRRGGGLPPPANPDNVERGDMKQITAHSNPYSSFSLSFRPLCIRRGFDEKFRTWLCRTHLIRVQSTKPPLNTKMPLILEFLGGRFVQYCAQAYTLVSKKCVNHVFYNSRTAWGVSKGLGFLRWIFHQISCSVPIGLIFYRERASQPARNKRRKH